MPVSARQDHRRSPLWTVGCLLAGLLLAAAAQAADALAGLELSLGRIRGPDWSGQDVRLLLDLEHARGEIRAAALELPPPIGRLRDLRIDCRALSLSDARLSCADARIRAGASPLDGGEFRGRFEYHQAEGRLRFAIQDLPLARARWQLTGDYAAAGWRLELAAAGVDLARVQELARSGGWLPADLGAEGQADLQLGLEQRGRRLDVRGKLGLVTLTASTGDGKYASDKLAATLQGEAQRTGDHWQFRGELAAQSGQAYAEPVFLDLAQGAVTLSAAGEWQPGRLALSRFVLAQPEVLQAEGRLLLAPGAPQPLQELELRLPQARLPGAYQRYLQPFLIGTVFDSLETAGAFKGELDWRGGRPQALRLALDDVHLDDSKRRFALYGARGSVDWNADAAAASRSRLSWAGGSAYRVAFGAAQLDMASAGPGVRLEKPVRIPVLDGALDIRRLEMLHRGQQGMRVAFDGVLEPLDMEELCRALDWPVFSGTLGGSLPTLEYADGNLSVGGTLKAQVFDGTVAVDRLRLEQPFGLLPRLSADLVMRNIDLEPATGAFSFGRIEGRLDGDVKGLRLLKWRPVAFDGRLYTTPGDRSRHRISQRAIENISDLGGSGAAGVLSRGFLRFFEDFAYDRIALGCRLQDGVCEMSGLEPARNGGYYIVKGRLVPRIDVIGFASRVSWDAFVGQLKSITEGEGPVIK